MLTWTDGDVYDVFMREFEISYEHLGQVTTIPLIPGGQDIPVTNGNRELYVKAYMDHYLHEHIRQEFTAFQRGFEKICGGEALKVSRAFVVPAVLCVSLKVTIYLLLLFLLISTAPATRGIGVVTLWKRGSGHARP